MAFISTPFVSHTLRSFTTSTITTTTTSSFLPRSLPLACPAPSFHSARLQPSLRAVAASAAVPAAAKNLVKDPSGNVLWTLRTASSDADVNQISQLLLGKGFPTELVRALVRSECCLMAEAEMRSGEKQSTVLLGAALADVEKEVADMKVGRASGLVEVGSLYTVIIPDDYKGAVPGVELKLVLAVLKKMKGMKINKVTAEVHPDDAINKLYKQAGLERKDDVFKGLLVTLNPDPEKKIMN